MANNKNLKSVSERTSSELREKSKKGSKISGKKRRENANMREMYRLLVETPTKDGGAVSWQTKKT